MTEIRTERLVLKKPRYNDKPLLVSQIGDWEVANIRINKQWRLVFTWSGEHGEARGVYLNNHDYR